MSRLNIEEAVPLDRNINETGWVLNIQLLSDVNAKVAGWINSRKIDAPAGRDDYRDALQTVLREKRLMGTYRIIWVEGFHLTSVSVQLIDINTVAI